LNLRACSIVVLLFAGCGQSEVHSTSVSSSLVGEAASAGHEEIALPIETIFDQGESEWCWAFSAYHTLRTYNAVADGSDSTIAAWRAALTPLDSQQAFTDFMSARFDPGNTGDPGQFVTLMTNENNNLPPEAWTEYYPSDFQSYREARARSNGTYALTATMHMSATSLLDKVAANLRKNVPSVFCNPQHCRMIYGATFENGTVTQYLFADSIGGTSYDEDADTALGEIDLVMTLP
jgi:hypothetical protein